MRPLPPLLALTIVLSAAPAAGPTHERLHALVIVNDTRSHGTLGDNFLSLNEAIGLNNQTLDLLYLSPAEAAQIQGFGDIAYCRINAIAAPLITMERELDAIDDTTHGFGIVGFNGVPVIDLGTTRGIVSNSTLQDFGRLILRNGTAGITLTQTDAPYGSLTEDVRFENQTQYGFKLVCPTLQGTSRLILDRCTFVNVPDAVIIEDTGVGRTGLFDSSDLKITGATNGVRVRLGPGGNSQYTFANADIQATGSAMAFTRAAASDDRALRLLGTHMSLHGGTTALQVDSAPVNLTFVQMRSLEAVANAGGTALRLGAAGTRLSAELDEARIVGNVSLAAGTQGGPPEVGLLVVNARTTGAATWTLGAGGASVQVLDSILDSVTLATTGASAVRMGDCLFNLGTIAGTATAPLQLDACHLNGTQTGGWVTATNAVPAPQLGSMEATPLDPLNGTNLTLTPDLPTGLFGLWFFGPTAPNPLIGPPPMHIYADIGRLYVVPAVTRGTTPLVLPIPPGGALRGANLFFHLAVVPDVGRVAPPLALPPGRRVVVR